MEKGGRGDLHDVTAPIYRMPEIKFGPLNCFEFIETGLHLKNGQRSQRINANEHSTKIAE